jgi:hypothetical protein
MLSLLSAASAYAAPVNASFGADPSSGWLSYAVYTAAAGATITHLSAKMTVPDDPKRRGAEPAFWFGVQNHAGNGALVQPIEAKWIGER